MPECLDNYPWRSIKGCGDLAPAMFKVGDYKNVVLLDGTEMQFRIIGFNHDKMSSGMLAPITWEAIECLRSRFSWNARGTNEGSWENTRLRRQMNDLNGDIYSLLPEDLREVITPVIKQTADTYNGENRIIETEDKLWIKSEKELFGRSILSAPGEGHWYEWYRQEDVPWTKQRGGSNEYTMLRSPCLHDRSCFCLVDRDGLASYDSANYAYGVAPAFCT